MEPTHAWHVLGIEPSDDAEAIRAAYAARLLELHPDRSAAPGAHDATVELTTAYRTIRAALGAPPAAPARPDPPPRPRSAAVPVVAVAQLGDDTIGIGAPPEEAFAALIEASHRLGELVFVEPSSGMLQVVVEFVDGPVCQLLVVLQGRATGVTEAILSIEPVADEPPPLIGAVTRLLLDALTG